MAEYVIGVDGGGTKTHCALFDTDANFVDLIEVGPTNHEYLKHNYQSMEIEIKKMINKILERNSISKKQIVSSMMGLSGIDTNYQKDQVLKIIERTGLKNFFICNDAYLGVKTASPQGYGVCAVNGTGYKVVGIDPLGDSLQIGGMFELTGDIGGGMVIGRLVSAKIYETLFKIERKTVLHEMIFDLLEIKDKRDYMDALIEKNESGEVKIKDLNKLVFAGADCGDELSLEILFKMGQDYGLSINSVIRELDYESCSKILIILAGSIFIKEKNNYTTEVLNNTVSNANTSKHIEVVELKKPPVCGAVIWALSNYFKDNHHYEKVISDFDKFSHSYENSES